MSALRTALSNVLIQAVEKAGRALVRDFGEIEQLQVSAKGPGDFVTNADRKSESIILDHLTRARPDFAVIAEESAPNAKLKKACWIVDPLDGTTNFLHGVPYWAITAAAVEEGEVQAAVTFNPITGELFWADRGRGAFLGNQRLSVAKRRSLADSLIVSDQPKTFKSFDVKRFARVLGNIAGFRRPGASALDLAYLAAGRYDGAWMTDAMIWDRAAGILLVREAGGMVSGLDGSGDPLLTPGLLAANPDLFDPFVRLIQGD